MYTFLSISCSAMCSPLSVRYGAIEMTAIIIIIITEFKTQTYLAILLQCDYDSIAVYLGFLLPCCSSGSTALPFPSVFCRLVVPAEVP